MHRAETTKVTWGSTLREHLEQAQVAVQLLLLDAYLFLDLLEALVQEELRTVQLDLVLPCHLCCFETSRGSIVVESSRGSAVAGRPVVRAALATTYCWPASASCFLLLVHGARPPPHITSTSRGASAGQRTPCLG
uniref:Uncharacterized protein n=1 Tax=Aegilops tauschii subsp. strangulata TaxID=200361 RepID=A0A453I703_AEGTS